MTLNEFLFDPISYTFMQNALIAAILVGFINGIVGSFVVVRGMAFFGDALAHTILPGVAAAYIYTGGGDSVSLFIGGLIAGVGSALGIGWLTYNERLKEDTAIGIIFVAMFALGIAIISTDSRAYGRDLIHILFGNILGINSTDLMIMAILGLGVVLIIALLYKELVIISFDRTLAQALKLPVESLRLLLLILMAVVIVASLQIVGIALMMAMLVTPAATARLLSNRMHQMTFLAGGIGSLSSVVGIYISYHLEVATGPAIVLTITGVFMIVFGGRVLLHWIWRA